MKTHRVQYAVRLAVIFTLYFMAAHIGLNVYSGSNIVTVIWLPAGIALASILLFGYKVTPAISAAILVQALTQQFSILGALAFTVANTIEPLLGAWLLQARNHFDHSMERVSDVVRFIVLAASISTAIGATLGVMALLYTAAIHPSAIPKSWAEWWVSDALGDLLIVPLALVWSYMGMGILRHVLSVLKGGALLLLLVIATIVAFWGVAPEKLKPFILAYAVFPLLVWISLRFRQLGSVNAIFIASLVATVGTLVTYAHASAHSITHELILLQTFMGATAATFLIISAGVNERDSNYQRRIELATRADELDKQKLHLQALNQAKDDFVTIASHQLKTPPTVIKQYVGMLLSGKGGRVTEKQREMLQHAYDSNEKQLRVIRDILNIAQLDTGRVVLHKEEVDLVNLITDVVGDKSGILAKRQQTLNFVHSRNAYPVKADRIKLYMVLDNLLDNASKYSPEGKAIVVKLTTYNAYTTISIKDGGIGFSSTDTPKLFRKFARIDSATIASTDGTGIGLYWAKKIVDLHGGTITAKSKPGRGSTFQISLPRGTRQRAPLKNPLLKPAKTPAT